VRPSGGAPATAGAGGSLAAGVPGSWIALSIPSLDQKAVKEARAPSPLEIWMQYPSLRIGGSG
jgi:hypothetical protein